MLDSCTRWVQMAQRNADLTALVVTLMVMVAVNLAATGYLLYLAHGDRFGDSAGARPSLPADLATAEARDALFEKLTGLYNSKDYEGIYSAFDPAVQAQTSSEAVTATLEGLHTATGDVESGAYSHYDVRYQTGSAATYALIYTLKTALGTGVMTIEVYAEGDGPSRLTGLNISRT